MTKTSEKTEVAPTQDQKKQKSEMGMGRVVGSRWHYALVLVFVMLLSVGIWSRAGWKESVANLVLIVSLAGAGFAMCYAMTRVTKNRMLGFLVAVIYMSSPYLLSGVYVRMALGELAVFLAAPIWLLGLYQLTARERQATRNLAVAMSLLMVSQSMFAILFIVMGMVYVLINIDKVLSLRCVWRMVLAVTVTLGLTAFFTVPLVEAWLDGGNEAFSQEYVVEYFGMRGVGVEEVNAERVRPAELLNLDYNGNEYGVALGAMAMIGVLGYFFAWRVIQDKVERRFVTSMYIIGVLAVVMAMMNWGVLPSVAWRVEYPWRMMMIATLALSVVAGETVFALVRRMTTAKQAVFAIVMGVIAVWFVAAIVKPESAVDVEGLYWLGETVETVWFWVKCTLVEAWEEVRAGFDFAKPAEIGMLVSMVVMGLGVMWVIISGIRDWYKRRKQKEVDSLIDSVWEAMAENEGVPSDKLKDSVKEESEKPKRVRVAKQKTALLPEPPAPEVPGLEKPAKKSARKSRAKKADEDGGDEKEAGEKKTTTRRTTTRKTTARTKSVKAKVDEGDSETKTKPRVTRVKAGAKKEV